MKNGFGYAFAIAVAVSPVSATVSLAQSQTVSAVVAGCNSGGGCAALVQNFIIASRAAGRTSQQIAADLRSIAGQVGDPSVRQDIVAAADSIGGGGAGGLNSASGA
jgi:hypothetical protein